MERVDGVDLNEVRPCGLTTMQRCWRVAAATELLVKRPGGPESDIYEVAAQTPLPDSCSDTCWRVIGSQLEH